MESFSFPSTSVCFTCSQYKVVTSSRGFVLDWAITGSMLCLFFFYFLVSTIGLVGLKIKNKSSFIPLLTATPAKVMLCPHLFHLSHAWGEASMPLWHHKGKIFMNFINFLQTGNIRARNLCWHDAWHENFCDLINQIIFLLLYFIQCSLLLLLTFILQELINNCIRY